MTNALFANGLRRVAIIDDASDGRTLMAWTLSGIGFHPYKLEERYNFVEDMVQEVKANADLAVCDHFLQPGGYAAFVGAEPVAQLYKEKIPAVLISRFLDQDIATEIRPLRQWIPRMLRPDIATNPAQIAQSLEDCFNELQGEFAPDRIACRTLIRVERSGPGRRLQYYDVIVPSWNADHSVRLKATQIPTQIRRGLDVGDYFIAKVNTGAHQAEDLFFEDFEPAPAPLTEEELVQADHS